MNLEVLAAVVNSLRTYTVGCAICLAFLKALLRSGSLKYQQCMERKRHTQFWCPMSFSLLFTLVGTQQIGRNILLDRLKHAVSFGSPSRIQHSCHITPICRQIHGAIQFLSACTSTLELSTNRILYTYSASTLCSGEARPNAKDSSLQSSRNRLCWKAQWMLYWNSSPGRVMCC